MKTAENIQTIRLSNGNKVVIDKSDYTKSGIHAIGSFDKKGFLKCYLGNYSESAGVNTY